MKVMINQETIKNKSDCLKNISLIKNNINNKIIDCSIEELSKYIINGHVIIPAILSKNKKLKKEYFKSQQVFFLDIDNKGSDKKRLKSNYYTTPEQIINIFRKKGIEPSIIYETYSSTKEWIRFRVVICLDKEIKDIVVRDKIMYILANICSVNNVCIADVSCIECSRVFFPGKKILYISKRTVSLENILSNSSSENEIMCNKNINSIHHTIKKSQILINNTLITDIKNNNPKQYKKDLIKYLKQFNLDLEYIKSFVVKDQYNSFEIVSKLPLYYLLGLPLGIHFNCLFHNDDNPSAIISQYNEAYFYKCFSDSCVKNSSNGLYNVFGIFNRLINKEIKDVVIFFKIGLEIDIVSSWKKDKFISIQLFRTYFNVSEEFENMHPILLKYFKQKRLFVVFNVLLDYASINMLPYKYSSNKQATFFISLKYLIKLINNSIDMSIKTMKKKLKILVNLGLINILKDEEINQILLNKANKIKINNKYLYRQNFYTIPIFSETLLDNAENIIKQNNNLCIRQSHMNYVLYSNLYKKEKVDSIYAQDVKISDKNKRRIERVKKKLIIEINNLLEKKGFTYEKEIKRLLIKYRDKDTLYDELIPSIQIELSLLYVKASNDIRNKYKLKLPHNIKYQSNIFIKGNK